MKRICLLVISAFYLVTGCASSHEDITTNVNANKTPNSVNVNGTRMKIKIGNSTFAATLYDNATATAFKSLLPVTVNMLELNGNEKYADLSGNLPTKPYNPGTIQPGDLMLYGSSTLVLFYKTFSTSHSYTKLGRLDNTSGLTAALGPESVTVTFELE